jgi:hypothetical protein
MVFRSLLLWAGVLLGQLAAAQSTSVEPAPEPPDPPAPIAPLPAPRPFNDARILGVIPDFQTITETGRKAPPLTRKQKWLLAIKETADPFNVMNAALTAGFSQVGNQTPKYGEGASAYGRRFGAALADFGTQNFFSAGVVASLLHQDPRYFRKGEGHKIPGRVLYSVSRIAVTRQDSGRAAFNASGLVGMSMGIAASNLYYPSASIRGSVMLGRVQTSLFGSLTGNLVSEFWPDVQKKFFHRRQATRRAKLS